MNPPSKALLTDPKEAEILDGVWYLHYTSPSDPRLIDNGVRDSFPDAWKPQKAEEKIATSQFNAKGSVTAAGINVDTSSRVVKQIFDVRNSYVKNEIDLDFGNVVVGGPFRQSENVDSRAVVSFQKCDITLRNGFTLKLGFLFDLLALARRTKESGWLETTFIDSDMRIGRGNKGKFMEKVVKSLLRLQCTCLKKAALINERYSNATLLPVSLAFTATWCYLLGTMFVLTRNVDDVSP